MQKGIAQVYLLIVLLIAITIVIAKFFYINITPVGVVGASTYKNLFGQEFVCGVYPPGNNSNSCSNYLCISNGCFTLSQTKVAIPTPSVTPTKAVDETVSQNREIMTIKGQILDSNSQSFNNPDLIIASVDSSEKCNVDSLGNFICSTKVIKGKSYGVYLNDLNNKRSFVLQYFGGDPGKPLELGIQKAPWTK